jgi:hypothetical protein
VPVALGKLGLAVVILGFFAATFGAALETGLSAGYTDRAVLRLAVGQVRAPRAGRPVPRRGAGQHPAGRGDAAHHHRPRCSSPSTHWCSARSCCR